MQQSLFGNIFSVVFADPLEPPHPFVGHEPHFVQSHLTPGIADEVLNSSAFPKHSFLHWILQNSKQPEVTQAQVG
jgi:hypothetical protein